MCEGCALQLYLLAYFFDCSENAHGGHLYIIFRACFLCDVVLFILLFGARSIVFFFFSSRRRHTRSDRDWSSDVCSSDLCSCQVSWKISSPKMVRPSPNTLVPWSSSFVTVPSGAMVLRPECPPIAPVLSDRKSVV